MAGPRAAGGRSQPPAQPGRLAGGRARFHPLLPGGGVLSAPGTAPSVCFNSWLCLLYLPLPGRVLEGFVPPENSNHHPEANFGGLHQSLGSPRKVFCSCFPGGAVGRAPRAPDVGTHPPFAIYTTATSLLARVRNKVDSVKFCCSPPRIVPGCLPCKR